MTAAPLYEAVVARARAPHWYLEGGVPDTLDGRFDMVTAVIAMVLLRLEGEGPVEAAYLSTELTELFVTDMDAQVRQIGFGDMVVGKQIGRMMAMLGGRLGAYRDGLATGDLAPALIRNLWRGAAPAPSEVAHVAGGLRALRAALNGATVGGLRAGQLP